MIFSKRSSLPEDVEFETTVATRVTGLPRTFGPDGILQTIQPFPGRRRRHSRHTRDRAPEDSGSQGILQAIQSLMGTSTLKVVAKRETGLPRTLDSDGILQTSPAFPEDGESPESSRHTGDWTPEDVGLEGSRHTGDRTPGDV